MSLGLLPDLVPVLFSLFFSLVSLLLQLGVNVNAKDSDGWTPLHAAAHWGQKEVCELLADHGANFSARNKTVSNGIPCRVTYKSG